MERRCKRLVCILLSFLVIAGVFTFSGAKTEPWSAYQKFIPNETPVVKRHLRECGLVLLQTLTGRP